uniref:Uncharacterized protein n=1 Tax=Tetranychus urticae TaxID=32264 RepID=T1KU50_TETUR
MKTQNNLHQERKKKAEHDQIQATIAKPSDKPLWMTS